MKLESGRFKAGEKVVVSAHGRKYTRRVRDDQGKPYVIVNGEHVGEDGISNNRKCTFDNNAYKREQYDRIGILTPKGTKDIWKSIASDLGMSLNAFIIYCVEKEIH